MRWLEIGKYFPPEIGGIEHVSGLTADVAADLGLEVEVIAFTSGTTSREQIRDRVLVSRFLPAFLVASAPISFQYLRYAILRLADADIVHLHSPNPVGALAVLLSRRHFKLIVHWHSDVVSQKYTYWLYRLMESLLLRRADHIIVTSLTYASASTPLLQYADKIVALPLGIGAKGREGGGCARRQRSLLACGRLVSYKGFDVLIDAMSRLPEQYSLQICGEGPLRGELQRQVLDLGLARRVTFEGRVSNERLRQLMDECDIFCMPSTSRAEAFGVAVLEAFSARMAVVGSAVPGSGLYELIEDGRTGLQCAPKNPVDLARVIETIGEDRELREALAREAYAVYASKYTEVSYRQRFATFLKSVVHLDARP